jgi:hypothetical protein
MEGSSVIAMRRCVERYISLMAQHLEVNVIKTPDHSMEVAIFMPDFNKMVILSPEAARTMAFSLMQCADHIQPPFDGFGQVDLSEPDDERSIFEFDDEDDEDDEDE